MGISLAALVAACVLLVGCGEPKLGTGRTMYVSILPLKHLVERIVEDDFDVCVLVPSGASPETFEPTPKQYIALNEADMIFNVGLIDFETALLGKIEERERIVDLGRGVEPIAGSCAHVHEGHRHVHGVDPHLWTSPRALQQMARNAYEAIRVRYPDSTKYAANHDRLQEELRELDRRTGERIAASGVRCFLIYHPALTYYARDYGIEQIAIEADGKEPSARRLGELIRRGRAEHVGAILYQRPYPESCVEVLARDLGIEAVEIDPLAEDFVENIDRMTDLITRQR